jgi:uncharacterized membrane protein YecN with MAPEG domain
MLQAQANFAELVPFTMLLFGLCELDAALPVPILHALGFLIFMARLVHYYGTGLDGTPVSCRIYGTVGTIGVMSMLCLSLLRYGMLYK